MRERVIDFIGGLRGGGVSVLQPRAPMPRGGLLKVDFDVPAGRYFGAALQATR